jgi:hypothetical protein
MVVSLSCMDALGMRCRWLHRPCQLRASERSGIDCLVLSLFVSCDHYRNTRCPCEVPRAGINRGVFWIEDMRISVSLCVGALASPSVAVSTAAKSRWPFLKEISSVLPHPQPLPPCEGKGSLSSHHNVPSPLSPTWERRKEGEGRNSGNFVYAVLRARRNG